jgi:hypothetical protein
MCLGLLVLASLVPCTVVRLKDMPAVVAAYWTMGVVAPLTALVQATTLLALILVVDFQLAQVL